MHRFRFRISGVARCHRRLCCGVLGRSARTTVAGRRLRGGEPVRFSGGRQPASSPPGRRRARAALCGRLPDRPAEPPAGQRRILLCDRAGHGIQALFQHGDAGIEPVAVAVEGVDGGSKPPRLVLAVLGDGLEAVGLLHQIDGRDLVAPPAERGLVGHHGDDDGRNRATPHDPSRHSARRSNSSSSARKPLSTPPVFPLSKLPARWSEFLAKTRLALLEACQIKGKDNRKCARNLNPGVPGAANRLSIQRRKRFKTAAHR